MVNVSFLTNVNKVIGNGQRCNLPELFIMWDVKARRTVVERTHKYQTTTTTTSVPITKTAQRDYGEGNNNNNHVTTNVFSGGEHKLVALLHMTRLTTHVSHWLNTSLTINVSSLPAKSTWVFNRRSNFGYSTDFKISLCTRQTLLSGYPPKEFFPWICNHHSKRFICREHFSQHSLLF